MKKLLSLDECTIESEEDLIEACELFRYPVEARAGYELVKVIEQKKRHYFL